MLESLLTAVHVCFGVIGLPANLLLIAAILSTRDILLQTYSLILLNIAVTDVIAIITDMLSMTRIIAQAPWVIFIYQGACNVLDQHACFLAHDIMVHLFFHSILLIAVSFWFRNAVLARSVPSNWKLHTGLMAALLPTLVLICTFDYVRFPSAQKPALAFLKKIHPDIKLSDVMYSVIDTFTPGGAATTLWVCIHPFVAYTVIIYYRIQVKLKLLSLAPSMSAKSMRMHECLIKTLTYHALLPASLCVAVCFFLLQQFDVARNQFLESTVFMSTTIPSVFNPLLTLYFVGPYRRFCVKLFHVHRRTRITDVATSSSR